MDKSEVKAWVDENIDALKGVFGLAHWDITIDYGRIDDGVAGECAKSFEYEQAWITLDPEEVKNPEDLEKILKHELCHAVHSPFDMFYESVGAYIPDEKSKAAMKTLWINCQELTAKNLERMHHGHKTTYGVEE